MTPIPNFAHAQSRYAHVAPTGTQRAIQMGFAATLPALHSGRPRRCKPRSAHDPPVEKEWRDHMGGSRSRLHGPTIGPAVASTALPHNLGAKSEQFS